MMANRLEKVTRAATMPSTAALRVSPRHSATTGAQAAIRMTRAKGWNSGTRPMPSCFGATMGAAAKAVPITPQTTERILCQRFTL